LNSFDEILIADVENGALLAVALDLYPMVNGSEPSRIKVRCSVSEGIGCHASTIEDAIQSTDAIGNDSSALSRATMSVIPQQHKIYRYLEVVLVKLDVFVRIVDNAVKVRPRRKVVSYILTETDSPICPVHMGNCSLCLWGEHLILRRHACYSTRS
jgi:hypothetical protein